MNDEYSNLVSIYKNTPFGVFLTNSYGKLEKCNDNLVRILGYDSEKDVKHSVQNLFAEVEIEPSELERIVGEIIEKKDICIYEVKAKRKDGAPIEIKISVKAYNESPANEIYFVGLIEDITGLKAKEKESRLNELKYKDLFENSSDAIFIVIGHTILESNKKARDLFELPENVEDVDTFGLFPEKQPDGSISSEKANIYIQETLKGNPQKFEWQFRTFKKKQIYCEVSLSKFSSIGDDSYHVIVHDISDRALTEQKLKESKEWYKLLVDTAPVGILRTNLDGKILFLNKKLAEIAGFRTQEEFLEYFQNMQDIYKFKDDRDRIIEQLSQGKIVDTQLDVLGIDQKTLTVNIIASPVFNKAGIVDQIVTIVDDITEKVKLERQIRERDEMLFSVVNSLPFELIVTDRSDKIIVQNDFSRIMFGDFIGKNVNELPVLKLSEQNWEKESKVVYAYEIIDKEINIEREGKDFYLRRIKTPLMATDKVLGIITLLIDITERKLLQREIEQHRDNLESLVKSRTKEVGHLNEMLQAANDELLAANEYLTDQKRELEQLVKELKQTQQQLIQSEKMASVGVLTAGIAHEINNPVNFISSGLTGLELIINDILEALDEYSSSHCAINGSCEWKQKFDIVDKTHRIAESKVNLPKLISTMRNGVHRTTEIVRGLRTFSRLDVEHMLPSNINELIDSSLIILRNKYKNRIEIVKDYGVFEPVNCFPGKLSQVFLNLVMNAIQAIEDKGRIEIRTKKEKGSLVAIIRDNGRGIPPEVKNKIFDPFFTTKSVGEGTGLGLSIVHSIISEHNGEIEVHSEVNKGTEFRITLPIGVN